MLAVRPSCRLQHPPVLWASPASISSILLIWLARMQFFLHGRDVIFSPWPGRLLDSRQWGNEAILPTFTITSTSSQTRRRLSFPLVTAGNRPSVGAFSLLGRLPRSGAGKTAAGWCAFLTETALSQHGTAWPSRSYPSSRRNRQSAFLTVFLHYGGGHIGQRNEIKGFAFSLDSARSPRNITLIFTRQGDIGSCRPPSRSRPSSGGGGGAAVTEG